MKGSTEGNVYLVARWHSNGNRGKNAASRNLHRQKLEGLQTFSSTQSTLNRN